MSSHLRLFLAAAFFSAWMVLLLSGFAFGGAVHLSLVAALVFFPWREARSETVPGEPEPEDRR